MAQTKRLCGVLTADGTPCRHLIVDTARSACAQHAVQRKEGNDVSSQNALDLLEELIRANSSRQLTPAAPPSASVDAKLREAARRMNGGAPAAAREVNGERIYQSPATNWEQYPSVTTICGYVPESTANLDQWRRRVAVETILGSLPELTAHSDRRRQTAEALRLVKQAEAQASERGTRVHGALEAAMNTGDWSALSQMELAPEELKMCLGARDWLEQNVRQPLLVETTVYHDDPAFAGTMDLMAECADGQIVMVDYKTGRRTNRAKWAMQLAALSNANHYQDASGQTVTLPPVQRLLVLQLAADGRVREIDLTAAREPAWRVFRQLAAAWHEYRTLRAALEDRGG